jgi:hypothetical protein
MIAKITKTTKITKAASSTPAAKQPPRPRRVRRTLWIPDTTWRALASFLSNRSSDLALTAIVLGAFVAVFQGSVYSATTFGFSGNSAIAFAIMPDALMVLSAARMRRVGAGTVPHRTARTSMYYGLVFSLLTNMIAALLRYAPSSWITPAVLLAGAVIYHGVVVIFLWRAVETLTKKREDRKIKAVVKPVAVTTTVAASEMPAAVPVRTNRLAWADTMLGRLLGDQRTA